MNKLDKIVKDEYEHIGRIYDNFTNNNDENVKNFEEEFYELAEKGKLEIFTDYLTKKIAKWGYNYYNNERLRNVINDDLENLVEDNKNITFYDFTKILNNILKNGEKISDGILYSISRFDSILSMLTKLNSRFDEWKNNKFQVVNINWVDITEDFYSCIVQIKSNIETISLFNTYQCKKISAAEIYCSNLTMLFPEEK